MPDQVAYELDDISPARRALNRAIIGWVERAIDFLARHWLFLLNTANFAITGLAFLVPVLMAFGLNAVASPIFDSFRLVCHQLPYRSDFVLGYQVAMCQRNVAIYASMSVAGVVFALVRTRLRPLPWRIYLLLILPMAVDGFTQLFGWRESNWTLRTVTGTLFGVSSVWLAYPHLQAGIQRFRDSLKG